MLAPRDDSDVTATRSRLINLLTLGTVDLDRRASDRQRRIAAAAQWAKRGALVNRLLPAFLFGAGLAAPHPATGTRWLVLADLALIGHLDQSPAVSDLVPGPRGHVGAVLPRGTTLRMTGTEAFYGYDGLSIVDIQFNLVVEDGPLAGRTVCLSGNQCRLWRVGLPRATLAAAMIVAQGEGVASDPAAARARYDLVVATLQEAGTPTKSVAGYPWEPVSLPADLAALGGRPGPGSSPS
jgi:hypothetical protein